ncbi:MAG: hypothetical protein JWQ32_1028 [Marmoricola sp.]|nr:hypothetical protein [Marmoricola sp.]
MRLRRKQADDEIDEIEVPLASSAGAVGPVDIEDLDPDAVFIDLGSMLVRQPPPELDLRLQVDEESGEVMTVLLVGEDGVLEMRAFSAARGGDLWADARREIAADTTRRGGTSREQEGPFGTELYCEVPVTAPDGSGAIQPSRVIGCTGPRWFVRATLAGLPAQDPDAAVRFEDALRGLAVRRGNEAMPPGKPLPLHLPPEARPATDEDLG